MLKIRSKEEVLKEYANRYSELDNFALHELSKEYERYIILLKGAKTKEEALQIFENEIKKNEQRYKDNALMDGLEVSSHYQFLDILANYGLIVFFRDNMLE